MAVSYGLLQLPKMPELRHVDVSTFPTIDNLDLNAIPYKEKQREKMRRQKLRVFKTTGKHIPNLIVFNKFIVFKLIWNNR